NANTMSPTENVTQLLMKWSEGDETALEQLMPLVYSELRRLASNYLRRERQNHTLQPTAMVNEAYLKLVDQRNPRCKNRAQFYGGLSIEETAEVLGVGHATVERDWKMARAWLRRKLESGSPADLV